MSPRRLILICSTAVAVISMASPGVHAASTSSFRLRADVLPVSCDVSLSDNGQVDFGTIYARELKDSAFIAAGVKTFNLTITCDAAAKIAVTATDGRKGTAAPGIGNFLFGNQNDASTFGVGKVEDKPVGAYVLYRENAGTADGATARSIVSNDGGGNWLVSSGANNAIIPDTRLNAWAAASGAVEPGSFVTITQPYKIKLGLNKKANLPAMAQDIPIDGLTTFTITYM